MKKIVSLIIVAIMFMSAFSLTAGAYRIGDVVGYALTTDITATINGYDIPSYNVSGHTYIVVEDLRYYVFSVYYDNASRSLSVSRDYSQEYVSKVYEKPYVSPNKIGAREHKLLYTDIVTYLDGSYVPSSNINGQTIIRFDALSAYGGVSYDNNKREISLDLAGLNYNPFPVDRESKRAGAILGEYHHYEEDSSVIIFDYYDGNIDMYFTSIGQNGNRIATALTSGRLVNGVCNFRYIDSHNNEGTGVLRVNADGTINLSFNDISVRGFWGISAGEGKYYRVGDAPSDFEQFYY